MKTSTSNLALSASRLSASLRHRLMFLAAGNLLLLGFIFYDTHSTERASFTEEMSRLGPNIAPHVLAGIGLTGIIFTGAIDLSIGAIIVVAGTVLGILYETGCSPLVCFAGCFLTAVALSQLNGYAIRFLKIPPIIVTLAGLTFYRGLALLLADFCLPDFGGQISIQNGQQQRQAALNEHNVILAASGLYERERR